MESCVAANLVWQLANSRPASCLSHGVCPRKQSVVPAFPMLAVSHAQLLAFRGRYTTGTVELSCKGHESPSSSDEPEPKDKTALMLVLFLPRAGRDMAS